jgi:hypothetical protein
MAQIQFKFKVAALKRLGSSVVLLSFLGFYHQILLLKSVPRDFHDVSRQLNSFARSSSSQSSHQFQRHTDHIRNHPKQIQNLTGTPSITSSVPQRSPWAYCFLLGGARLEREGSDYRAGLFSVVAATHYLRKQGSTADVVLMVQLSVHADPTLTTLADWEQEMLQKSGIRVTYLPRFAKPIMECFYSLVMEKFRILTLTEYKRVMFLDYDIFPKCNLDYMFELSDPQDARMSRTKISQPLLKANVVLGYKKEPSNAGMFILEPNLDDYQLLLKEIKRKEERALQLPYPHWDDVEGWGHVIDPSDAWQSPRGENGTRWTWPYAYADQGLLFYWTKYVKKSVSLVRFDTVESWGVDSDDNLQVESTVKRLLDKHSPCHGKGVARPSPYTDFIHFTGNTKPWQINRTLVEEVLWKTPVDQRKERDNWYYHLMRALTEIDMVDKVPWDFMGEADQNPSVGRASSYVQMALYLRAKKNNGWNQYADPATVQDWAEEEELSAASALVAQIQKDRDLSRAWMFNETNSNSGDAGSSQW